MREYVAGEATSLKNFTDVTDAQASFAFRTLLKAREIRVNGKKVGEDCPLKAGDVVRYYMTPAQERKAAFSPVYEDDNILIVDKESGVNSEAVFAELSRRGTAYFIHRIDRNTEGLLVFAKTVPAEEELLSAFRERRVEKVYHALVLGTMSEVRAKKEAYLVKDAGDATVKIYLRPRGEKIVTEYEVLERRGNCTLLKVILHTGKTHQIRAHLAFLGYPVVGDEKYGDSAENRAMGVKRQRLVAKELSFHTGGVLAYLDGRTFTSAKSL